MTKLQNLHSLHGILFANPQLRCWDSMFHILQLLHLYSLLWMFVLHVFTRKKRLGGWGSTLLIFPNTSQMDCILKAMARQKVEAIPVSADGQTANKNMKYIHNGILFIFKRKEIWTCAIKWIRSGLVKQASHQSHFVTTLTWVEHFIQTGGRAAVPRGKRRQAGRYGLINKGFQFVKWRNFVLTR